MKVLEQSYELVSLDKLNPHPDNARKSSVAAIGESIDIKGSADRAAVAKPQRDHFITGTPLSHSG